MIAQRLRQAVAALAVTACVLSGAGRAQAGPASVPPPAAFRRLRAIRNIESDSYDLTIRCAKGALSEGLYFGLDEKGNSYRLRLEKNAVALDAIEGVYARLLARSGDAFAHQLAAAEKLHVCVRRRWRRLAVLVDDVELLGVMDNRFRAGSVAVPGEGAGIEITVQDIEEISFADDFVRKEGELGQWRALEGKWSIASTIEEWKGDVPFNPANIARSSNPFALAPDDKSQTALAVTGYPFWSDYRFSAAVRSHTGTVGLVFAFRDKERWHSLDWAMGAEEGSEVLRIVQRRAGETKVLAQRPLWRRPDQWYRLDVRTAGPVVQAFVDGCLCLETVDASANAGIIGLRADGCRDAVFDDVSVESNLTCDFSLPGMLPDPTAAESGWSAVTRTGSHAAAGPAVEFLTAPREKEGLLPLGGASFESLIMHADLSGLTPGTAGGFVFGSTDEENYWTATASVSAGGESTVSVRRVTDGRSQVIASEAVGVGDSGRLRLALHSTVDGRVELYANDVLWLRAQSPESVNGRIGLIGRGGVRLTPPVVDVERRPECEKVVSNEVFRRDSYMEEWAAPSGSWIRLEDVPGALGKYFFWHKGDFLDRYKFEIPIKHRHPVTRIFFACQPEEAIGDPDTGYRLDAHWVEEKTIKLSLSSRGDVLREFKAVPPEGWRRLNVGVERNGLYAVIFLSGFRDDAYVRRDVIVHRDVAPCKGTRLGFCCDLQPYIERANVQRENVWDDLFDHAITDWWMQGIWQVTNRYHCDPRWSWLNGTSRNAAVLWSKRALEGDMTVEFYAAMRMSLSRPPMYPRPGDMNLTICGDGRNLSSGYSFILGGWGTTWTRILRENKIVAETDAQLVPSTRFGLNNLHRLHRRWFYVKVRKTGNRLDYYLDNHLVLSYEDPNPLAGKHLAIWTVDNSIMVARVKVAYRQSDSPGLDSFEPRAGDFPRVQPHVPDVSLSLLQCPMISCDFESGLQGWASSQEECAELFVSRRDEKRDDLCLCVRNRHGGGDAAASLRLPAELNLARVEELSFDYCIERDCKVNLYLTVADRRLFVRLTGPEDSDLGLTRIGEIADAKDDGVWRTARFPLGATLRSIFPNKSDLGAPQLVIGNLHPGYLRAGFGGNHAGAVYRLDNFVVTPVICERLSGTVTCSTEPSVAVRGGERIALTGAGAAPEGGNRRYRFSAKTLEPGDHALSCSAGAKTRTYHFRLAPPVPQLARRTPENGVRWGGEPLRMEFASAEDMLVLDPPATLLMINGKPLPGVDPSVKWDFSEGSVSVDLSRTDFSFADSEVVTYQVTTGAGGRVIAAGSVTMSYDLARHAPGEVVLADAALLNGFEEGPGGFTTASDKEVADLFGGSKLRVGHDTVAATTDATASSGKRSLEIHNTTPGGFCGGVICSRPFDIRRWPVLCFDYRMPKGVTVNLMIHNSKRWWNFRLTDADIRRQATVARIEDVQADDEWHTARVNMLHALSYRAWKDNPDYMATAVAIGDTGWHGAPVGTRYWLDEFRAVPLVPSRNCRLRLRARDVTGIKGYGYKWDNDPKTDAPTRVMTTHSDCTFDEVLEGRAYLHVRAQNNAGVWGPTSHIECLVDSEPPTLVGIKPERDACLIPEELTAKLRDDMSGVRYEHWNLELNGKPVEYTESVVRYSPAQGVVRVRIRSLLMDAAQQGEECSVRLGPIRDNAGNGGLNCEWRWKMDLAQDTDPPEAPAIEWKTPHKELVWMELGKHELPEHVQKSVQGLFLRPAYYDWQKGGRALGVFPRAIGDEPRRLLLHEGTFSVSDYPVIALEGRFRQGASAGLELASGKQRFVLRITSPRKGEEASDYAVPTDNKWHAVWLDIAEALKPLAKRKDMNVPEQIDSVALVMQPGRSRACFIANFMIVSSASAKPSFHLDARDVSGIANWRWQFSREPALEKLGAPAAKSPEVETEEALAGGLWYLYAQAQDRAGNWSAPAKRLFFVRE